MDQTAGHMESSPSQRMMRIAKSIDSLRDQLPHTCEKRPFPGGVVSTGDMFVAILIILCFWLGIHVAGGLIHILLVSHWL